MVSEVSNLSSLSADCRACEVDRSRANHPPNCDFHCQERVPWKRDVALEISVDGESAPR